ncbi:hypothetical protein QVD17_28852 [Tagetes erecta]|uniref:Uncharacterized protein n=1 Tax=Tagetes erecta TaxID=13708 RepID=A0AAD8NSH5_TARER|nr:hypothetical protein QVD17_28852 [Tagetes erecta]
MGDLGVYNSQSVYVGIKVLQLKCTLIPLPSSLPLDISTAPPQHLRHRSTSDSPATSSDALPPPTLLLLHSRDSVTDFV